MTHLSLPVLKASQFRERNYTFVSVVPLGESNLLTVFWVSNLILFCCNFDSPKLGFLLFKENPYVLIAC
ncbi:hypothetical protein QQP08_026930 [Theobroma cacao]|nr:hypothetical protein QQP08_026930 [Theobroma cacao]